MTILYRTRNVPVLTLIDARIRQTTDQGMIGGNEIPRRAGIDDGNQQEGLVENSIYAGTDYERTYPMNDRNQHMKVGNEAPRGSDDDGNQQKGWVDNDIYWSDEDLPPSNPKRHDNDDGQATEGWVGNCIYASSDIVQQIL